MPRRTRGFAIPFDPAQLFGEEEERKPAQPVIAQVCDLQAAYASLVTFSPLQPGDLARERDGMGFISANPPVLIIMRLLDMTQQYDRELAVMFSSKIPLVTPDCIVAVKDSDGDLRTFPHERWRLEKYEGEMP